MPDPDKHSRPRADAAVRGARAGGGRSRGATPPRRGHPRGPRVDDPRAPRRRTALRGGPPRTLAAGCHAGGRPARVLAPSRRYHLAARGAGAPAPAAGAARRPDRGAARVAAAPRVAQRPHDRRAGDRALPHGAARAAQRGDAAAGRRPPAALGRMARAGRGPVADLPAGGLREPLPVRVERAGRRAARTSTRASIPATSSAAATSSRTCARCAPGGGTSRCGATLAGVSSAPTSRHETLTAGSGPLLLWPARCCAEIQPGWSRPGTRRARAAP